MASHTNPTRIVFAGGTVVDGTGAEPVRADVAVEGDRIVEVGHDLSGDVLVNISGQWLIPGLIDCHVHAMVERFDLLEIIETPFSLNFYLGARNLERTLAAGITSARDLGGADLGVKTAIELGLIDGPDLQIAINIMSVTGGHGDHWSVCGYETPDLLAHPGRPAAVCDGPEQVAHVARTMIRAGADVLKVCTTGGLLSPRDHPFATQFTRDELDVLVAVASDAGKPVVAHAQSPEGIQRAIRAGIRTIEHGFYLDEETVALMVEHEVVYVPTMMALHGVLALAEGRRASEVEQARQAMERHRESVALAHRAGVRIAMGTDAGAIPHGTNREELALLSEAGLTSLEAIRAATQVSSQNLGIDRDRGTIAPGQRADLIVSSIDPIDRLDAFCAPGDHLRVWKSGAQIQPKHHRSEGDHT